MHWLGRSCRKPCAINLFFFSLYLPFFFCCPTGVPDAGRARPPVPDYRAQAGPEVRAGPARVQPAQGPVGRRPDRLGPAQGPDGAAAPGAGAVRPAGRRRGLRRRGVRRRTVVRRPGQAQVAAGRDDAEARGGVGGPDLSDGRRGAVLPNRCSLTFFFFFNNSYIYSCTRKFGAKHAPSVYDAGPLLVFQIPPAYPLSPFFTILFVLTRLRRTFYSRHRVGRASNRYINNTIM